jgi:hypothetical protein
MSLYDLLPPNATTLERDFSRAVSSLERVGPAVPTIRTAKRTNIPDGVVPWLIYEYGLNELLPYLGNNQRRAIEEGVQWQRLRGTPQALRTALGWIGFQPLVEESEAGTIRWAEFQLGLDQPPDDLEITDGLIGVSRLSAPVRSRLFRVYSGYDHRRFLLDDHELSGGSWLCDHTGVYLRPDWPQLSFGRGRQDTLDYSDEPAAELGVERIHGILGLYEDRFTLNNSQLDEFWHLSDFGSSVRSRLVFIQWGPLASAVDDWSTGTWETGLSWAITNSGVPAAQFAKAGIYLSDGAILDDTNTCFAARFEQLVGDGAFLLSEANSATGESVLSGHVERIETREWLERLERTHAGAPAGNHEPNGGFCLHRETQRVLRYDDRLFLDQHLLSEWPQIADDDAIKREHGATGFGQGVTAVTWDSTRWVDANSWLTSLNQESQLRRFHTATTFDGRQGIAESARTGLYVNAEDLSLFGAWTDRDQWTGYWNESAPMIDSRHETLT